MTLVPTSAGSLDDSVKTLGGHKLVRDRSRGFNDRAARITSDTIRQPLPVSYAKGKSRARCGVEGGGGGGRRGPASRQVRHRWCAKPRTPVLTGDSSDT